VNLYCLWEDRENACSEPVWFCAQLLANPREIPCSNCHHFNNHIRRYQCPIGTPKVVSSRTPSAADTTSIRYRAVESKYSSTNH
jgi:hypothetical protein